MEYTLLIAAKQSGLPNYSPHENIAPHYGVITMMGVIGYLTTKLWGGGGGGGGYNGKDLNNVSF